MDGQTEKTFGRTDSSCVLPNLVPLWGRSPAYLKSYIQQITQQGKGTGDQLEDFGKDRNMKEKETRNHGTSTPGSKGLKTQTTERNGNGRNTLMS